MKIIYISKSIIPSKTANSIHVMKMCQAWSSLGHDVTLLAPGFEEEYEKNVNDDFEFYNIEKKFEIKKIKIPALKGRTFLYGLRVLLFLLFNKSDLVYGRFLLGCYFSLVIRRRTVFESHSCIYSENKFQKYLFSKILKNKYFSNLVVISESLKNKYLKNKVLIKNIIVAHDGADEVNDLSLKIALNGTSKINIGYIGHLYTGKGMEVIEKIAPQLPDISFHIVGGLPKDINLWMQKISSSNVFFYGFVKQEIVQKYINSMDICLLPNQKVVHTYGSSLQNISEYTSPLKMFEYMASKKAIIASNLAVLREVLNKNNSYLVDSNDYDKWIEIIEELKDPIARKKISEQAYVDFKSNFTWKQRAKNILENLK